ncbi:unnamed protein product, partial [Prorocentrum cordatum]
VLPAAAIAPGNRETLNRQLDPARRPPTLSRRLPADPDRATDRASLDKTKFPPGLGSAKKGTAAEPARVRVEHLKPLREHDESMDLLGFTAAALTEARVPAPIARALVLCKRTAFQKPDNGARDIATSDVFRRLVTRPLAQQLAVQLAAATAPFQFALTTRAGTDCAATLPRSKLDHDDHTVIVSIDGVGGEGVEQGGSLAPALFALALHGALVGASRTLEQGDFLVAFLDDVYIKTTRATARAAVDTTTGAIHLRANVYCHLGKSWADNKGGGSPGKQLLRDSNAAVHNPLGRRQLDAGLKALDGLADEPRDKS